MVKNEDYITCDYRPPYDLHIIEHRDGAWRKIDGIVMYNENAAITSFGHRPS